MNMNAVALCAVGAEKTVSNEIRKLNLKVSETAYGRVKFNADLQGLYRALMGLRAADRVLLEVASFEAADFGVLFDGIQDAPWEAYIPPALGIRVAKVRSNRSKLEAETSIQGVVHKAAAERLCKKRKISRLPETAEDAELRVHMEKDKVSALLDLSGEPLFKRGYRTRGGAAPLRETTAAALILHSMWRRKFPLYDPFCGSGTIAIEAAMYAWDIAPGLGRTFAVERLLLGDKKTEALVREEFLEKVDFSRLVRIGGSDSDAAALRAARDNAQRAQALGTRAAMGTIAALGRKDAQGKAHIPFRALAMEDARPGLEGIPGGDDSSKPAGFILTNPPYGRRLGDRDSAEKTYAEMEKLARNFPGWKLGVITEHSGFESFFGRKADSCREISNGAIRSYFYQYEEL